MGSSVSRFMLLTAKDLQKLQLGIEEDERTGHYPGLRKIKNGRKLHRLHLRLKS